MSPTVPQGPRIRGFEPSTSVRKSPAIRAELCKKLQLVG